MYMDSDDAKALLDGLVFTARLTQANIHARFTRANVIHLAEGDSWQPLEDEQDDEMDTSNWMVAAINPRSSGAHVVLRHNVTRCLAEHPEQFTSLTASELHTIGDYFDFTERPDLWDPFTTEKEQTGIFRRVLDALSRVDHTWYLSLYDGHLSLGEQCGKDYCTGFCGLGLQP